MQKLYIDSPRQVRAIIVMKGELQDLILVGMLTNADISRYWRCSILVDIKMPTLISPETLEMSSTSTILCMYLLISVKSTLQKLMLSVKKLSTLGMNIFKAWIRIRLDYGKVSIDC